MRHEGRTGGQWMLGVFVSLLLAALGCNGGGAASSSTQSTQGNYHPTGWISVHPASALANIDECKKCHEMSVLRVGSSIPSCMTAACHHGAVPGWSVPGLHGLAAKSAATASGGGLLSCQLCHGRDFAGGPSGNACSVCHGVPAPHPAKPWHSSGGSTHSTTDPSNAAVCAQCHFPGSPVNPPNHPANPAPAGTSPSCFNNTLCHGNNAAPHLLGEIWRNPTSSSFHGLEAKKDLLYCQSCHGTPGTTKFDGGATSTKCSSCHTTAHAHSKPWYQEPVVTFPGYVASHRNALNRDTACSICHDYTKGRTAPDLTAPSCFSSSQNGVGCHANGPGQANHSVPFLSSAHTNVNLAAFNSDCQSCHAITGTSPVASAPSCTICHQAGSPLTLSNCASCHAKPPSGSAFPNVAGVHAKHDALAGITGACSNCHDSFDSGTQAHYDHANARPGFDALRVPPAPVKTLATFNAKAGAAVFTPTSQTCSNVSCHGGQTTPSWQNGSINVNTDAGCRQCHTLGTALGVPENNSPYSGLHALHLGSQVNALCTDCHSMNNGTAGASNHFMFLNTPQMEGPAKDTVAPLGNPAYYLTSNQSCGTFTCHGTLHTTFSWNGGAPHAVPYLDSTHTGVNQAGFSSNCAACHAVTGSSPLATAPNCAACHQAASPLSVSNCASCHEKPPLGSNFPDVAGKHGKHNALAGITGACSSCHTGSDSGTLTHYDHANGRPGKDALRVPPAPVSVLSAFNAKSGTGTFSPSSLTCSSMSCHGGIQTPSWADGSISSSTDPGCRQCHALGTALGVPENNSPFSGLHAKHLGSDVNALCTDCHAMGNGTTGANNHFKFLSTPQMEGPASDTVAPLGNPTYYLASNQTCGTFTCHGTLHAKFSWTGGAPHPVPYLDSTHTGVTQAQFTSNCAACHAVTGSSPDGAAPNCAACHQAGSPLTLLNCTSCHAKPPNGSAFPNIAGSHGVHDAFPGITGVCAACHQNVGTGTTIHYDHANGRPGHDGLRVPPGVVNTLTTYNAKSGPATFDPSTLTCSNVSCHGAQTTPNWQTGHLDVNTQCTACHAYGSGQYNSFYSGQHNKHVTEEHIACVKCHNTTTLATNHFSTLGTAAMEGPASATIGGGTTSIPAGNYSAPNCTPTCHGRESWQ